MAVPARDAVEAPQSASDNTAAIAECRDTLTTAQGSAFFRALARSAAGERETHVQFIVKLSVDPKGSNFPPERSKAGGFVQTQRPHVRGVHADVDLPDFWNGPRELDRAQEKYPRDTLSAHFGTHIHPQMCAL